MLPAQPQSSANDSGGGDESGGGGGGVVTAATTSGATATTSATSGSDSGDGSDSNMQAYPAIGGQNASSFGMQNAGFYSQGQSPYGMLQQSYPMADGEL